MKRYRKGRLTTQRKRRGGVMPRPAARAPEQSAKAVIASIVAQTAPEKARPHRVITPGGQDAGIQGLDWTVTVNKSVDTSNGIMDIVKRLRDRKDAKMTAAEDAGWWARAKMAVKSKFPSDTEYLIDLLNTLASEGTMTMTAMEHATIQKLTNKLNGLYAPPSALPSSA
jgi:hypothetical protein